MVNWLEDTKNNIVRISTPYSTGNGIAIPNWNLIVCPEHIVRDCRQVLVEGIKMEREKQEVLFLDEKYDVALIKFGKQDLPDVFFDEGGQDEDVLVVGLTITSELIIKEGKKIPTSAHKLTLTQQGLFNAEFNGSAVFNVNGKLLGIGIFNNINYNGSNSYLPVHEILKAFNDYRTHYPVKAIRCSYCEAIVVDYSKTCGKCRNQVKSISHIDEYEARGIHKLIEDVIESLGYEVEISRRGISNWMIDEGSADITITYNEKSGFIVAEATLAYSALEFDTAMFTYLMKQNYFNKGMSFNLKDNYIILSLMIYDQHLHFNTCKKLVGNLIKCADRYDTILISEFGAKG